MVELHCLTCPEVVTIGDHDETSRAAWVSEFVQFEGWRETPAGLICGACCNKESLSQDGGRALPTVAPFNPLAFLDPESPGFNEQVNAIADSLIPLPHGESSDCADSERIGLCLACLPKQ